ncbi:hypothetical protein FQN50_000401 [Emmonsiellopsis sp. PD_5]|nr:hypothetical protein FQN50_000401 [Emmonsiellopsis sp. PD_5]
MHLQIPLAGKSGSQSTKSFVTSNNSMTHRVKPSDLVDSQRLVADECVNVYRIDERTVAKLCDPRRLAEAKAMQFVRAKTSVPVPEVYDAYVDESTSRGIILMEYVEGDVLRDVWDKLNPSQRSEVISQLRSFMDQLHAIKGDFIGSVDGTPCDDPVFCAELGGFGPYKSEGEFNEGIIKAMKLSQDNTWVEHVARFVRAMPPHEIVPTHSDFSPRNILVRGDQVVAILDWEMAGFYPAYWEYVKALYHPAWQSGWIADGAVELILKPFHLEHAVLLHVQSITW